MSNEVQILWVDDDRYYPPSHLSDELGFAGFSIKTVRTVWAAKEAIEKEMPSVVIIDIMMPIPRDRLGILVAAGKGGIWLAKWIKNTRSKLPFIGLSRPEYSEDTNLFVKFGGGYLAKGDLALNGRLLRTLHEALGNHRTLQDLKSFIVHGTNSTLKQELKNFLQGTLGMPEPVILDQQASGTLTIIEKFEAFAADNNDVVFVILAPEDQISGKSPSSIQQFQPRPNVFFELGYFVAKLGRKSGRVILLRDSGAILPTDISGIVYINITKGIREAEPLIRKELERLVNAAPRLVVQ